MDVVTYPYPNNMSQIVLVTEVNIWKQLFTENSFNEQQKFEWIDGLQ